VDWQAPYTSFLDLRSEIHRSFGGELGLNFGALAGGLVVGGILRLSLVPPRIIKVRTCSSWLVVVEISLFFIPLFFCDAFLSGGGKEISEVPVAAL